MPKLSLQTKLTAFTSTLIAVTVGLSVFMSARREAMLVRGQADGSMRRIALTIRRSSARVGRGRIRTLQELLDRLTVRADEEADEPTPRARPEIAFITTKELGTGQSEYALNPRLERIWKRIPSEIQEPPRRIAALEALAASGKLRDEQVRVVEIERIAEPAGRPVAEIRVGYCLFALKRELFHAQLRRVAAGLVLVGLGALGARLLARHVLRPVSSLAAAAKAVANGDLGVSVEPTTRDELRDLTVTFNGMVVGLRKQRQMWQALTLAAEYQARLLPQTIPQPHGWQIAAKYVPSSLLSGDFYDLLPLDDSRLAVAVGDVSGKGVPAALLVAGILGVLRTEIATHRSLSDAMTSVNSFICRYTDDLTFASMFLGVLDLRARTLSYCSAGHEPPLLLRKAGQEHELVEGRNTLLGVWEDVAFRTDQVTLEPDDVLLLYTDGVTDRQVYSKGRRLAREGLLEFVRDLVTQDAPHIVGQVCERLSEVAITDEPPDDLTLVAIKAVGDSESAPGC